MTQALVLTGLMVLMMALGTMQFILHQQRIRQIPIRVHINGTRGKSSVTRLIGAGLRAGGLRTIVKVTGTFPRLILDTGEEVAIHRRAGANILEQLQIVDLARRRQTEALVIECMALQPRCQWITEHQMIHATVGVLTNVRLDHCDVMGETLEEITRSLGSTIPHDSTFFTAETHQTEALEQIASDRGSAFRRIPEDRVTTEEMARFPYLEHAENVALSLEVCTHLGVDRDAALAAMVRTEPDSGALTSSRVTDGAGTIDFWNAFAANDPESTWLVWRRLDSEGRLSGRKIALLNTRNDRGDRSRQLADLVIERLGREIDQLVVMGDGSASFVHRLLAHGFDPSRLHDVGTRPPDGVFEALRGLSGERATVVGIGNIGGHGAGVVDAFRQRSLNP